MPAELRSELASIVAAQGALARQIQLLQDSVTAAGSDTRSTRTAIEALEASAVAAGTRAVALNTRLSAMDGRLGGIDTQLQRISERVRLGPVALLLVLTNLILLAAAIALLVRGR